MITIIDYGCGNLHSLKYALASVGLDSQVSCCEADILGSSGVILPGVGAFGAAMESIRSVRLDQTIHSFVGSGKKLMGICLGMHLLYHPAMSLVSTMVWELFRVELSGLRIMQFLKCQTWGGFKPEFEIKS